MRQQSILSTYTVLKTLKELKPICDSTLLQSNSSNDCNFDINIPNQRGVLLKGVAILIAVGYVKNSCFFAALLKFFCVFGTCHSKHKFELYFKPIFSEV